MPMKHNSSHVYESVPQDSGIAASFFPSLERKRCHQRFCAVDTIRDHGTENSVLSLPIIHVCTLWYQVDILHPRRGTSRWLYSLRICVVFFPGKAELDPCFSEASHRYTKLNKSRLRIVSSRYFFPFALDQLYFESATSKSTCVGSLSN